MRRYGSEMTRLLTDIIEKLVKKLSAYVKNYCKVHNYQNSTESCDWENAKDAVERSIIFLTGEKV